MAGITNPRPKRRVYQSEEAPFPVPIETITRKEATDGHWFFYTGHLSANCVLVKRQGDIIFLYRMGFFGKGILSKSKPQHQQFESSYQGIRKKNLPPKERKFQQQRFQQIRHHKYERHLSWQRLLAEQLLAKRNQHKLHRDQSPSTESHPESPNTATSSSSSTSNEIPSFISSLDKETISNSEMQSQVSLHVKDPISNSEKQSHVSLYDIPSTSGFQTRPGMVKSEHEDIKKEQASDVMEVDKPQIATTECAVKGVPMKQRDWMGENGEVSDLSRPPDEHDQPDDTAAADDVTGQIGDVMQRTNDDAPSSDEEVEELIIVSDDDGGGGGDGNDKEVKTDVTMTEGIENSKANQTGKDRTKKVVKKTDPFKIYEHLQLCFEEAFFLSFGLGCLSVLDEDEKPMMLGRMWRTFCARQANFLPKYVVYHYLRSKGWVPKGGAKYGADFVLYKKGPPFYHATYSVFVSMIDEHDSKALSDRKFWNWPNLTGKNRITETVAKEVLVCYVLKPPGIQDIELASPKCLHKFKVQEVVMKRWVSSREREPGDAVHLIS